MTERVTLQMIADSLGLSRNTVSKAINNTGGLAESTRNKILQRAVEMGYKQFTYVDPENLHMLDENATLEPRKEIAVLTGAKIGHSHFSSTMLDKFQREITQLGYSLSMHSVTQTERKNLILPRSFHPKKTAGILCVEIFDYAYSQKISSLGLPLLFVDSPVLDGRPLQADILLMDNRNEIYSFIREMKNRGKTKLGFVGDFRHCQSFFERFMAFREAMFLHGLTFDENLCVLKNADVVDYESTDGYNDFLMQHLLAMDKLPEVFLCANDFIAISILQVLRKMNISVPDDIYLCGFDNAPEAQIVTPPLTSIQIHSEVLGFDAVNMLLARIKNPTSNYRTIYSQTNLIYRESTNN